MMSPPVRSPARPGPAGRAGAALVIALLVVGVLSLLGAAFLSISATEVQIATNERQADQAFFVAEAGLTQAIRDLLYDLNFKQTGGATPSWIYNADPTRASSRTLNGPLRLEWDERSGRPIQRPAIALDLTQGGAAAPAPPQYLDPTQTRDGKLDWFAQPWVRLPYTGTAVGSPGQGTIGSYTVELLNEPGLPARIYVRATGWAAVGRARAVVRAELEAANLSSWNHAVYSGGPLNGGNPVSGNLAIRGSTYFRGPAALGSGTYVYNNYSDGTGSTAPDPLIVGKIPPLPAGSLEGVFRVRGDLSLSDSSSIGLSENAADDVKQTMQGLYVAGTTTAPAGAIHADRVGTWVPDVPPPSLLDYHARLDAREGTTRVRDAVGANEADRAMSLYRQDAGGALLNDATAGTLGIEKEVGCFRIGESTPSFTLGDPGSRLIYDRTAGQLTFEGGGPRGEGVLAFVDGCLKIRLPGTLQYSNRGTVVVNGDIRLEGEADGGALYASGDYPSPHSLGLIARDDITFEGYPGSQLLGAFFAGGQVRVRRPVKIGGAVVAVGDIRLEQAPDLYQVPALVASLPPGMPGGGARWILTAFSWREMHEQ
ncbi:MAG: PilX N-terminal domain-containing pilus assembly protein [candidate division NC10 bacterium]|nr:PilX N-terminal domain-containing pilus assembly protein [candidate division NC10 bacterium]